MSVMLFSEIIDGQKKIFTLTSSN